MSFKSLQKAWSFIFYLLSCFAVGYTVARVGTFLLDAFSTKTCRCNSTVCCQYDIRTCNEDKPCYCPPDDKYTCESLSDWDTEGDESLHGLFLVGYYALATIVGLLFIIGIAMLLFYCLFCILFFAIVTTKAIVWTLEQMRCGFVVQSLSSAMSQTYSSLEMIWRKLINLFCCRTEETDEREALLAVEVEGRE